MTTEQEQRLERVEALLSSLVGTDKYLFQKHMQLLDGRSIQLGKTTGTVIGTEATQKLGFFGKAPVAQQASIADPAGGATIDTQARTAINSILDVLDNLGLTA